MGSGNIENVKYFILLYFVIASISQDSVAGSANSYFPDTQDEPIEEVVSIYGPNFETPKSTEPYFIKVYRCINLCKNGGQWPNADNQTEIEIVVADINKQKKFYKYVVFNHTSCTCTFGKPTLHKNIISNEVSEAEFKAKLPNNPENLRRNAEEPYCSLAQQRIKLNPKGPKAAISHKLIHYRQCFPGCNATIRNDTVKAYFRSSEEYVIFVLNHTACAPYGQNPSPKQTCNTTTQHLKDTQGSELENGLLIYIASPEVFLAALILSLILVSILIVDFNLCHRKKGIMYSVLKCGGNKNDKSCPNCCERRKKFVEVV